MLRNGYMSLAFRLTLFKVAVCNSDCIVCNARIKKELERMWKEMVFGLLKKESRHGKIRGGIPTWEKTEMGRTCGTYGREERLIQGFSGET
jgi:hypothetical protein